MAIDVNRRVRRAAKVAYERGARIYLNPLLKREWRLPPIPELREYLFQFEFAMRHVARRAPREVLDVGSGMSPWPQLLASCGIKVTATDEINSYWGSMFNRHFYVQHDDIKDTRIDRPYEFVTCLHVLTCIAGAEPAVRNLFGLVEPGGSLLVTMAYKEHEAVEDAYALPGASYGQDFGFPCHMFCRADVDAWLADYSAEIEDQEYFRVFEGPYWASGKRLQPPLRVGREDEHHYTTICFKKL